MRSTFAFRRGPCLHYAASRSAKTVEIFATRTSFATPMAFKSLSVIQEISNSYHVRPWRAEVGCAWWLLCQPSPKVNSATHQLLRLSSRVLNRRLPHMCVAELISHVACRPNTTRKQTPHRNS